MQAFKVLGSCSHCSREAASSVLIDGICAQSSRRSWSDELRRLSIISCV